MGICASSNGPSAADIQEAKRTKDLSDAIQKKLTEDLQLHKLLLLGAGESGKSTLFKQLVNLYSPDKNPDPAELKRHTVIIHENIITNAKTLEEASYQHGEPTSEEGIAAREFITELDLNQEIDLDIAVQLQAFWNDEGIQACYENRALYQLNDSTKYFFERLDAITEEDYSPSQQDIVRTRVRTTGIVEHNFEIDENKFKMFDVGGQRNERKKWIHCFENVTAVMFVAAISEFDQTLFEDYSTNRMQEALTLFKDIVNSQWFRTTDVILFLNKEDLFREKIVKKNITDSECVELKAFTGDCRSYEETTDFLRDLFLKKKDESPGSKPITTHITCATDSDMVGIVFESVKKIIIEGVLDNYNIGGA